MIGAMRDGLGRALGAPRMILLLWAVNFAVALPAAWAITSAIQASAGHSLVDDRLRDGFDTAWSDELQQGASGLLTSFGPDVAGAGAVYRDLEMWITGSFVELPAAVLGAAALYLLAWILLQGGVLDHLSRSGAARFDGGRFLAASGRYFFRFLRLALISGVVYWGIFRGSIWLYGRVGEWTIDVDAERPVLFAALGVLALTALALAVVWSAFACAKIATVAEDRRSMLLAALAGLRHVLRRPFATLGACLGMWGATAVLMALYAWVAPVAGPSNAVGIALAFAGGQLFLGLRMALRVALLGALTELHGRAPLHPDAVAVPS